MTGSRPCVCWLHPISRAPRHLSHSSRTPSSGIRQPASIPGSISCIRRDERLEQPPAGGVRAVAYLRPDRFSQAGDDLGLMGTEAVISQLAQILRELVQATDIYGRFGGTMFAVVVERGTMADVETWARQLLDTISGTVFEHEERSTALTCSIGLCESDAGADLADLLERSGACMQGGAVAGRRSDHVE